MSTPSPTPAPPKRFLTQYEERVMKEDIDGCAAVLKSPLVSDEGKANAARAMRGQAQQLAQNSLPDVTPEERDKIAKRTAALEEKLKEGLLSSEEMRRNPHGAVDRNVEYEKRNKHLITRWRNGIRIVNKGRPAHELETLCNLDRIRPRTSHLPMTDAQIPQVRTMSFASEAFKANYDSIDFSGPDAVETPRNDPKADLLEQFDDVTPPAPAAPAKAASSAPPGVKSVAPTGRR